MTSAGNSSKSTISGVLEKKKKNEIKKYDEKWDRSYTIGEGLQTLPLFRAVAATFFFIYIYFFLSTGVSNE